MEPHRRPIGLLAGVALTAGGLAVVARLAGPAGATVVPPARTIAAGTSAHSLALKSDSTLWSFGGNSFGQLGTTTNSGTGAPNPAPIQVMTDVAQVAAGGGFSLVVKTDGTLWSFGWNPNGELGRATNSGSPTPNPTPAQVMTGVAQVAAGVSHSLAVKTDGTLWSFGSNGYGQLGTTTNNGTGNPNPTPTQVMTDVAQVAAGDGFSLAVKTDGTLWSFGSNNGGQLGTTTNSGTGNPNPTPIQVMTDVAQVDAGDSYSLVLKTDGTLWSFGRNRYGQLGTTTNNGTDTLNRPGSVGGSGY